MSNAETFLNILKDCETKYNFTGNQWKILSGRFNSNSFTGKILLIKQHKDIFKLEYDGDGNFWLRLNDDKAQFDEMDRLFHFPQNLSFNEMRDLLSLLDLKLFPAK